MRKFIFTTFVFLFMFAMCNFFICDTPLQATSQPEYYQITTDNAHFFSSSLDFENEENIICNLPNTYFVKPTGAPLENCIPCSYLGVQGYILTSSAVPVYSKPTTPYATRSFDIPPTASAVVREKPTTNSTALGTIKYGTTSVVFIGEKLGEKQTETDSGIWYYCFFANEIGANTKGYVYSNTTTNLTPLSKNTESVLYEPIIESNGQLLAPELYNTNYILLIALLTIPAIVILLLVIRPKKTKSKTANRQIASLNQLSLKDNSHNNEFDF